MSVPIPVTTRIMTADNGSSRSATGTEKSPEVIHVNACCTSTRFSGSRPASLATAATEIANDISIAPQAIAPAAPLPRRRWKPAFSRKPTSGRSGISSSMSPLQARKRRRVERLAVAEQRDHDRKADRGFGRRHGHHEEHDDLAVGRPQRPAERDEAQVHRVEHDLDRQQDRDDVAANQDAPRANGEQNRRQDEVVVQRRHLMPPAAWMRRPYPVSPARPRRPSQPESAATSLRTGTRIP